MIKPVHSPCFHLKMLDYNSGPDLSLSLSLGHRISDLRAVGFSGHQNIEI